MKIPNSLKVKFSKSIYNEKTKKYDIEVDENGISYMEDEQQGVVLSQSYYDTKKIITCKYCGIEWKHFHQCEMYKKMKGYYDNDSPKNKEASQSS